MTTTMVGKYLAPAVACLLAACGAPQISPFMRPPPAPRGGTSGANIRAARDAWRILADPDRRDQWPAARVSYNGAITASFDDLRRSDPDWNAAAAATGTRWASITPGLKDPYQLGALFPASKINVARVGGRRIVDGVGLPLVGWIDESHPRYQSFPKAPPSGVPLGTTAILRFDRGAVPTWELPNPMSGESVTFGHAEHPLSLDFSAAHALYWRMSSLDKHKIANVLRPDRLDGVEGMFLGQPMSRDRIPVIFVHGFNSSPDAFAPMVNELMGEEWFRRNYQIWFFSYPTGVPWMISAARFRQHFESTMQLARASGVRRINQTVIVGHSMGGLITHASLKDPGTAVYATFANKPLQQLDLRPNERRMLEEIFLWKPMKPVSRAIFIATPHQGSPMADTFYSAFGSWLIQLPKDLTVDFADAVLRNAAAFVDPTILSPEEHLEKRAGAIRVPTVIESLSPERPGIRAIQTRPFPKNVHLHSIIGDRGRCQTDGGSDGVVPYWSSHLMEAGSEVIVPANHSCAENPQAISEVKRILAIHVGENPR